jgi:OOP family OmpA-OmpF porin
MKRLFTAALLASALGFAAPAMAQDINLQGAYVGGSIGSSNYSTDECVGDCDKTDIGGKIFGGYMFTPNIGAEVMYVSLGKAKVNFPDSLNGVPVVVSGEFKSSGFGAFLVGQYPVDNFRLFGKIGFAYLDNELSVTGSSGATVVTGDQSESSTEFAWGLGATYMFTKNFGVRAEYENFKWSFEDASDNIRFWSIGIQYNF